MAGDLGSFPCSWLFRDVPRRDIEGVASAAWASCRCCSVLRKHAAAASHGASHAAVHVRKMCCALRISVRGEWSDPRRDRVHHPSLPEGRVDSAEPERQRVRHTAGAASWAAFPANSFYASARPTIRCATTHRVLQD